MGLGLLLLNRKTEGMVMMNIKLYINIVTFRALGQGFRLENVLNFMTFSSLLLVVGRRYIKCIVIMNIMFWYILFLNCEIRKALRIFFIMLVTNITV